MPVRLGIVGCGRVVELGHVPALNALIPEVEVVGIADPSATRREAILNGFGEKQRPTPYDSSTEMLKNERLDVVVIAVPHDLHETVLVDAVNAGVNIVAEKPLALSLESIDRIENAVTKAGVKLCVMHNWAYTAEQMSVFGAISAGRIGTPQLSRNESFMATSWASADPADPNWRLSAKRSGGGILIDAVYHVIYVAERELQSPIVRVVAHTASGGGPSEVEDMAVLLLEHASGGISSVARGSGVSAEGARVHEIFGSDGVIRFNPPDLRAISGIFVGKGEISSESANEQKAPVEISSRAGAWEAIGDVSRSSPWWSGMTGLYRSAFEAWSSDTEARENIAVARHVLEVVQAAYHSANQHKVVEIGTAR